VPRWNGIDDPHDVTIEDARGREAEFTLDRNGFALVKAPTGVADFYSPEEIKDVYYPEVERLVRDKLGASRVFVFPETTPPAPAAAASASRLRPSFRPCNTTSWSWRLRPGAAAVFGRP
jgi:hypothetical protein